MHVHCRFPTHLTFHRFIIFYVSWQSAGSDFIPLLGKDRKAWLDVRLAQEHKTLSWSRLPLQDDCSVQRKSWVRLYKGWIMLSNGYIAIQWISDSKTYSVIHWVEIYPVDSVIRPSNNRGQTDSSWLVDFHSSWWIWFITCLKGKKQVFTYLPTNDEMPARRAFELVENNVPYILGWHIYHWVTVSLTFNIFKIFPIKKF